MTKNSILNMTVLSSPLSNATFIKTKKDKNRRLLVASLMLTSLIDAFSILLIFVLMNSSQTGEILYISKDIVLPTATNAALLERNTIVKVENGKYFIEEAEVAGKDLVNRLLEIRNQFSKDRPGEVFPGILVIQADKGAPYEWLNSVVLAGNQTGYSEIRFATLAP